MLDVYQQLATVTEALCARLRGGDVEGAAVLAEERDALVKRLARMPAPRDAGATIERVLALDGEVLELLESLKHQTRAALDGLAGGRESLRSYRGGPGASAAFFDRLG